jgi:membrane protease YdiL (CAAX protease family)
MLAKMAQGPCHRWAKIRAVLYTVRLDDLNHEIASRRARLLFVVLLLVLTTAAYVPILLAGTLRALGGLALPLIMWAPGISAIISSAVCFRSLKPCGFAVYRRTWIWLLAGLAVPAAYTAAVYLPLEATGIVRLGGPHLTTDFLVVGFAQSLLFATGEEIGWRGFFAPLMATRFGFLRGNVAIGGIWALYHFPAILFAGYGGSANELFGLATFTITVIFLSVFLGTTRILSGSLWPAAFFHAAHNLLFLHVFDPMEQTSRTAAWLVGEQGALLCLVMATLAATGLSLQRRKAASASPMATAANASGAPQ